MRSVRELMDAQSFLEQYANTPITSIDIKKAREVLYRCGVITKKGDLTAKYAKVKISNLQKDVIQNEKESN